MVSKTKVIIKNLTKKYVAFRAKTTRKVNYTVNPSYYILKPKENKKVVILFYLKEKEEINPKGHKFKFEGIIISEQEKNKDAKELFFNLRNIKITEIKRNVLFIEDNDYDVSKDSIDDDENKNRYTLMNTNEVDLEHVEELENLKIEYYKLKNNIDNLKINYLNMKKRLELEQSSNKNQYLQSINYMPDLPKKKNQPNQNYIFCICFIASILIGFYLTK